MPAINPRTKRKTSTNPHILMSSNLSGEPLRIDPRSSMLLAWFLLIIHGSALALVPVLTLPIWTDMGIALGVAINLAVTLRTHALLQSGNAVVRLVWNNDERWILAYANGVVRHAELIPGSFVHPYLVILNFYISDASFFFRHHSVVLAVDAVDSTTFRRLRARLRAGVNNQ
ncbi:toxin CptA [Gammaproteobacteria bacterium]